MSELKGLKLLSGGIFIMKITNELLREDVTLLFKAVNKPRKCLRDILKTDKVNVWLYIRKDHFADDDPENISSDIMDYCYMYRYNICGITIAEKNSAFSKIAIPFMATSKNR